MAMLFPAPVHYPSNGPVTGGQVGHADLAAPPPAQDSTFIIAIRAQAREEP